jgi:hypothetical protein
MLLWCQYRCRPSWHHAECIALTIKHVQLLRGGLTFNSQSDECLGLIELRKMEPLIVLSLASNILQLLSVSLKTVEFIEKFRKDRLPEATVSDNSILLPQLAGELRRSIESVQPQAAQENELHHIAAETQ